MLIGEYDRDEDMAVFKYELTVKHAREFLKMGKNTKEEIAKGLGLTVEEVTQIEERMKEDAANN